MEGGSVTINQAIHTIDSLLWLIGPVVQVTGAYANNELRDVIETEDTAVAVFRFKNGVLGTLETTASSNLGWENTLFIHGTEGAVELRDGKAQKVAFADNAITTQVREALMGCYDPALIQAGKRYYGKTHPAQIEDFILAIREKRKPFILPQSARHTVEVVLALYQSQRQSEWISLPLQQEGVASR
jgi:UDP-N-acetyl-2-amino-2-deoxyglucuronate dehydrogenase